MIRNGELITLLGPSGCGKTTVLRMVAGLEHPTGGKIRLGGSALFDESTFVPPHQRGIGMVFQSYALWPHRTVLENVAFPLEIQKLKKDEIVEKAMAALKLVAMEGLEKRYPHELSGGSMLNFSIE
jgi:iron(III) transport system ATP-binding protein